MPVAVFHPCPLLFNGSGSRRDRDHLVVSPFAAGAVTRPGHFPRRNCIIAGRVGDETGEKSGTVHQVRESLAVGRPVLISKRVMMNPSVQRVGQLWGQRGVFVWGTVEEVRERIKERCATWEIHLPSFG
jgi:predicted Rossmann fold nucleotide-binding protein DprA/Smf involved in DNA uptake